MSAIEDAERDRWFTDHERDAKAREIQWLEREESIRIRTADHALDISDNPRRLAEEIIESPDGDTILALLVGNTNTKPDPVRAAYLAKLVVNAAAEFEARMEARNER